MLVLTVCSLYEGCSQSWMSQSSCALVSLSGLSLLELISAPHLPKDAVLRVQGKEQWLCFAGAAVKRYPTSKVRETQVKWYVLHRGAGTLLPSAQRFVWAARQPLGNAALGALFA